MDTLAGRLGRPQAGRYPRAKAYARAATEAPSALVQQLIAQMDKLTATGRMPCDGDAEIERLSVVLEAGEHCLHRKLDDRQEWTPDTLRVRREYWTDPGAEERRL